VIVAVREAESILIFGPGKAKDELRKRLETNDLGGRIVGVETVDKLTDRQIAAKVRRRFEEKHSTTKPRRNQSTGSTTRRGRTRS
jgi:hypothetical protein